MKRKALSLLLLFVLGLFAIPSVGQQDVAVVEVVARKKLLKELTNLTRVKSVRDNYPLILIGEKRVLSPRLKNQGSCGSCWAFGTL